MRDHGQWCWQVTHDEWRENGTSEMGDDEWDWFYCWCRTQRKRVKAMSDSFVGRQVFIPRRRRSTRRQSFLISIVDIPVLLRPTYVPMYEEVPFIYSNKLLMYESGWHSRAVAVYFFLHIIRILIMICCILIIYSAIRLVVGLLLLQPLTISFCRKSWLFQVDSVGVIQLH